MYENCAAIGKGSGPGVQRLDPSAAAARNAAIRACMDRQFGERQIDIGPQTYQNSTVQVTIRAPTTEEAFAKLATNPANIARVETYLGELPKPLFRGAEVLAEVIQVAGIAVATWGAGSIIQGVAGFANQAARSSQERRGNVALNLGSLLSAAGGIVGGISSSGFGNISQILGGGLQLAGAAFTPQATYAQPQQASYGPVYSPPPNLPMQMPTNPNVYRASAGSVVMSATVPILYKIYLTVGKKVSLKTAIGMIRKLSKFITSPDAIAVYLGITVAELATLITQNAAKKRRSMNPANPKALRRAARRIKGFHRMCGHIDLLKSRGRRATGGRSSCGTCKKSPCRC